MKLFQFLHIGPGRITATEADGSASAEGVSDTAEAVAVGTRVLDREALVRAEQIELLYRQAPLALIVSIINALIIIGVLWGQRPSEILLAWSGAIVAVSIARLILIRKFSRVSPRAEAVQDWAWPFTLGATLAGCLWGSVAVLLYVEEHAYEAFLAFVVAGMSAGGLASLSCFMPAYIGFVVPAVLPLAIRYLLGGDLIHVAMGCLVLLYFGGLLITARSLNRSLLSSLRLRYENTDLIQHLSVARAQAEEARDQLELRVAERAQDLQSVNRQLEQRVKEQLKADAALRESEQRFRDLVELAPIGILIHQDGKVVFANPGAMRLLGADRESDLIGRDAIDLVDVDSHDTVRERERLVLEGGTPVEFFELKLTRVDGTGFEAEVGALPFIYKGRRAVQTVFLDLSERKQIERQLYHAQKMEAVGQLTGGIAHDFNNLLTVVLGNLELLEEELGDDPRQPLVRTTYSAAHRGASLTRQLLAFSRRQSLDPQPVDVPQMIEEISDLLLRTLGGAIEVKTTIEDDVPKVMTDRAQLENALLNLAINARDAMPNGGDLTIEIASEYLNHVPVVGESDPVTGKYVKVAVRDSGSGMRPEVVDQAFEPFFTTKEFGKSSGLGLSMVYGFVRQSGGHIRIVSAEREGTEIGLYLPLAGPVAVSETGDRPTKSAKKLSPDAPGGDETILIVEDDAAVRDFVATLLKSLGYHTLLAPDVPDAISQLESNGRIDLVFTDIVMPGGSSGLDLAREIERRWPDIKVVLTTGYSRVDQNIDVANDIEVPLISKPYRRHELAKVMRKTLDGGGTTPTMA